MKTRLLSILTIALFGLLATSCKKENMKVIENSFTGNVNITSGGTDPAGDITGGGDSGNYKFYWENNSSRAEVNFDITGSGTMQMILRDADNNEVLNKTRTAGGNDTFSGMSSAGTSGMWTVEIIMSDVNGDGSFSLSPVN